MAKYYRLSESDFVMFDRKMLQPDRLTFFEEGKLVLNNNSNEHIIIQFENQAEAEKWLVSYFEENELSIRYLEQ